MPLLKPLFASTVLIVTASFTTHAQAPSAAPAPAAAEATLHIQTSATPINTFDPDAALGSTLDVLSRSGIDRTFTPHILQESLSAGWGPISYRNNSELRMAAWHWNDKGTWSDADHESGYFTGSTDTTGKPIRYIISYALPHRGFATSGDRPLQGPNLSYWKSNPYLTSKFTGESDALHPQWVIVDLQSEKQINAVKIQWQSPFATKYEVQYWQGIDALDFDKGPKGTWNTFAQGTITTNKSDTVTLKLADAPVAARWVRVLMSESSNTCDDHGSADIRNCVGYAMQSIKTGTVDATGAFTESPRAAAEKPIEYEASSIDPWHSSEDGRTGGDYQHAGFDLFFQSGITNNLPAMIPVTMLYGTPDDAAAQIAYIEKRGYKIGSVEMGEEPDGKHAMPEDYAALYLQWATAIHKVDPSLKLGGPVFEGVNEDITLWPDAQGRISWLGRFVAYLKSHDRLSDLAFVSFEHYPFEPCTITWKTLYSEPQLVKHILEVWRADGVPAETPLMITESSLAAQLSGPMSQNFAGLWLADNVGAFFEGGGAAFYHSPIQPQVVQPSCLGWASWSNFLSDDQYTIKGYTSFYFAAQLINNDWVLHHSGVHKMFPSTLDMKDAEGNQLVTTYAVLRPDGNWSVMLVNRDENAPHTVRVAFDGASTPTDLKAKRNNPAAESRVATFTGPVTLTTFGAEQYVWINDGLNSRPEPDHAPVGTVISADANTTYTLPKASITVLRGKITEPAEGKSKR